MKTLKYSRQRESIKASLMNRHDHPTADTLYASIREEYPNISLGTVYRNLNLLVETGEIQRLTCGDGADHFDGNPGQHYHFLCRECNQVHDIPMELQDSLNQAAQEYAPGVVDGHSVLFFGQCNGCLGKHAESGASKSA